MGGYLERRVVDNDGFWDNATTPLTNPVTGVQAFSRHDVVVGRGGVSPLVNLPGCSLEGALGYGL